MPNNTYDFTLDMETDNSNSLIIRKIKEGSRVLEFGSAHGRMTKYLKEQLKCEVFIVERNAEAGAEAALFAKQALIGDSDGNIENLTWLHNWSDFKFDYIVFADVVEHLQDPQQILTHAKTLLSNNGSIIISVPNISHNAVIVDLLQEKWQYRDSGILDRTHRWFFTYNSLKDLVVNCGLAVCEETNAENQMQCTEFKNSYEEMPPVLATILKLRKFGETYQFIWELKPSREVSIVIPVFNKWNFTDSALKDLSALDTDKVEIIVVDNGSADETFQKMQEWQKKLPNINYIRNETNLGFGAACNRGYSVACGNSVMFLNNDIRVKENNQNWIFDLMIKCTNNNLVGPTGGRVDPSNEFKFLYETGDKKKDINYISGWCVVGRKTVWDKFSDPANKYNGPFCEQYFVYHEDTHLGFRAKELNIELLIEPTSVVHFGKISSKQLNTHILYEQSRAIFLKNWKKKL